MDQVAYEGVEESGRAPEASARSAGQALTWQTKGTRRSLDVLLSLFPITLAMSSGLNSGVSFTKR